MARPKPPVAADKQFSVRVTEAENQLIDQLVAVDASEHGERSPNRTRWFLRLIQREARYRRLLPEQGTGAALYAPPPATPTKGRGSGGTSDD